MHVVFTTFAGEEEAAKVVRQIVEEKLAACGTILPGARSLYAWKGRVEDAREVVVIFKTARGEEMQKRLAELHPYETPEILVVEPVHVSASYARWVEESCSP